jgi:hypothetical protein
MTTFAQRRTPFQLDHLAIGVMFGVAAVVDMTALLMGEPFEMFSFLVGVAQPVLISIWCVLGRGSAMFRWLFGLGLMALLCLVKATVFATDLFTSGALALFYLHHFTIFPLALLLGRPHCDFVRQSDTSSHVYAVRVESAWQFGLREAFALITLASILIALMRRALPDGLPPAQASIAGERYYIVLLTIYGIALYFVTLPVVWTIWGINGYLSRRNELLTQASLCVYPLVALVALCAAPFIIPSALELVVLIPTLFAARNETQTDPQPQNALS